MILVATPVLATENWSLSGDYTLTFTCTSACSGDYHHTMQVSLYNQGDGTFEGTGFYNTNPLITWSVQGEVESSSIEFRIDYDGSTYYVEAAGTVDASGAMSGTAASSYQEFTWVMSPAATFNRRGEITAPEEGEIVHGEVEFRAYLLDNDYDGVQWAVREGTCAAGTNTVWGNVDSHDDPFIWDYDSETYTHTFSSTADTSTWSVGMHCFVFNPREDSGESNIRLTREFYIADRFVKFHHRVDKLLTDAYWIVGKWNNIIGHSYNVICKTRIWKSISKRTTSIFTVHTVNVPIAITSWRGNKSNINFHIAVFY